MRPRCAKTEKFAATYWLQKERFHIHVGGAKQCTQIGSIQSHEFGHTLQSIIWRIQNVSLSLSLWETYLLWYSIAPILKGAERNVFSSFFALFWLPYILQNVALDVSIRKKDFGFG